MGRFDGKTEKATPQRRKQARREGQVARSAEVGVALSLAGLALSLRVFAPAGMETLRWQTTLLLQASSADTMTLAAAGERGLRMFVAIATPVMAVGVLAALVAGVGQVGFSAATKAAKPKLSHLSPKKGLSRLRPATAGWELARTAVKLGLLWGVFWGPIRAWTTATAAPRSLAAGLTEVAGQTWSLLVRGLLLAGLVAAADYAWNRRKTARELRMSKQDVKQELRNSEGDPQIKAQRRRRAAELSRNRMMADVPTADVVVTNPTHLAVALRYGDGEAAPRVVAKGADHLAAKIRALAHRHGVLVTENKPLARALHRQCRVGAYVPAALYEAVAVVLALAYRRRGRVAA